MSSPRLPDMTHRVAGLRRGATPVVPPNNALLPGFRSSKNQFPEQRSNVVERSQFVKAGSRQYEVIMTQNGLEACSEWILRSIGAESALIVTTPTVAELYAGQLFACLQSKGASVEIMTINCTEASKGLDQVTRVCQRAAEFGLGRKGLLIGVGGGVCTDIVTVAASWIRRGIGYIRVPTTLIGQIDAGIGIKGAVNFQRKKSYLGCFFAPRAVVITPSFLATLPHRHLREGFAEMIKIAIVRDAALFELIELCGSELLEDGFQKGHSKQNEVIWRSIAGMLAELEPNIFEDQTYERLVDFGHTFSPALESISNFEITHGEAVSIDIAVSTALGHAMTFIDDQTSHRILSSLITMDLPIWSCRLELDVCRRALADCSLHRGGKPNLVVPADIGHAKFLTDEQTIVDRLGDALKFLEHLSSKIGGTSVPHCENSGCLSELAS